jgi:hypothetical protein
LILKKFEKEIVFESSALAWIRIRIEKKWWIRIRMKSIRIHNPGKNDSVSAIYPMRYLWKVPVLLISVRMVSDSYSLESQIVEKSAENIFSSSSNFVLISM